MFRRFSNAVAAAGMLCLGITQGFAQTNGEWQLYDVKWQNAFDDGPALGSNGFLYAFSLGWVVARDTASNGRTVFEKSYFDQWWAPGAISADGTLYIGNYSGSSVWAHDGVTGEQNWGFNVGVCVHACPAINADGTLYLSGTKLYAVDPARRKEKWAFAGGSIFESSPAIGTNGLVYAGCYDGKMYAIDAVTGAKVWDYQTGNTIISSPALGFDGTVYFGSGDSNVYALDGTTGQKRWEFPTGGAVNGSPIVGPDGYVYVGSDDTNVYSLNGATGAMKWHFLSAGAVQRAGALAADGTLYIAGVALNSQTGEKLADFPASLNSPTIGPDGTIYSDGFAFHGTSPLAASAWPKFHHNLENTGRRVVTGPPTITRHPSEHWAAVDSATVFGFYTPVARPLSIQWRFNGEELAGATNETLQLERVRLSDAGQYSVVVSNQFGRATSSEAMLHVGYDLTIFTEGLGSVRREPELAVYPTNSSVQLIALPQGPRAFVGWTNDASGAINPHQITLQSNLVVTARFELLLGDKKWQQTMGTYDVAMPAIGADGTLYVGSDDGNVYALDGVNGRKKWQFKTGGWLNASPALGKDGTVYIGSTDSNVYALDGTTGAMKWKFFATRPIYETAALGIDGTVYVGAYQKFFALDGMTGAQRWVFDADDGFSSPAIGSDGTIYLTSSTSSYHGKVDALDGMTGRKKWEFTVPTLVTVAPAVGLDDTVYIGDWDNTLHALDGATGEVKWQFRAGWDIRSPAVVGPDGLLCFGADDRKLHALDAVTGQERWSFTATTFLAASPAIGSDGTIYLTSEDSTLYALNRLNGAEKWRTSLGARWGWRGSPTLGPDGTLYVGYRGGALIALKASSGLAAGVWPKLHARADNCGRVQARPRLDSQKSGFTREGFEMTAHSEAGEVIRIEWSGNLQSWNVLGEFPSPTGTLSIRDPAATNDTRRFYRISSAGR